MKKIVFIMSCLVLTITHGQNLSVMTYNLRLDVASDGDNAWSNRKDFLVSQIQFYEPDMFGTQEGLPNQIQYINDSLKNYSFIGQGRDGDDNGEYSAIFYNTDKFELLEHHTFWLSNTPDKVSKGWDAAYIRICTYGLFKDKTTKKNFWMFNTHLDNQGEEARNNGMALILNKINEVNTKKYPVILTGDFNDTPESKLITSLKKNMIDARDVSKTKPFGSYGTFNGFKYCEPIANKIDYIFISEPQKLKVIKYGVLTDSKDMKFPSDHFPVFVKLQFE
ncbi:endonuclease/exonuclease/phosphatase family protein [Yeosuana marina]|uniref:endonuclease/exonuclease/phosphatase family protein n=1 Tax=Yeosuana marina TaxID=1565536 RepID=UPI0030C7FAA2